SGAPLVPSTTLFRSGLEHGDRPAVPDLPDLDGPVRAGGGEPFSVGAERHAVDFRLVPQDQRLELAEPHQVMPFPLAQVFRTLPRSEEHTSELQSLTN